jgi:hypothetical protein
MSIEHVRICGACERECPGWANRCPACGSLSLLYRITFIPAAVVAPESSRRASGRGAVASRPPHKGTARSRVSAGHDAKLRQTPPLGGKPETRVV